MTPGSIIAIAELARRHGQSPRSLKRRLKRLDAQLRATTGQGILVRFSVGEHGHLFADVSALQEHLPALVRGNGPTPAERAADASEANLELTRRMAESIEVVRAMVAGILAA